MSAPALILQLFVSGVSARSVQARRTLERVCDEHRRGSYEIEVVDVLETPAAAEDAAILATPTVVRREPKPEIRIVGDLSDEQAVVAALDIGTPLPEQTVRDS